MNYMRELEVKEVIRKRLIYLTDLILRDDYYWTDLIGKASVDKITKGEWEEIGNEFNTYVELVPENLELQDRKYHACADGT